MLVIAVLKELNLAGLVLVPSVEDDKMQITVFHRGLDDQEWDTVMQLVSRPLTIIHCALRHSHFAMPWVQ